MMCTLINYEGEVHKLRKIYVEDLRRQMIRRFKMYEEKRGELRKSLPRSRH